MRKYILITILALMSLASSAQDSTAFRGYLYNEEYQVYIQMDFYANDIIVPGQEIFGKLPGYLGARRDTRKWLFTDAKIDDACTATISITNDYGSEDLVAKLIKNSDGTYTLVQKEGSSLKIAVNSKWVKLPGKLVFVKQNNKAK